jgi:hypothetical protein
MSRESKLDMGIFDFIFVTPDESRSVPAMEQEDTDQIN